MQPLVSIIIPTYNRAHLIGETLDSVLAQTYRNWECIVVDDGSTDATAELLDFYCEKDSRIQYQHRPKNRLKGANTCRNFGYELSKGEYINWFDSDDLMEPEKLSLQLSEIERTGDSYCICKMFNWEPEKKKKEVRFENIFSSNPFYDYVTGKIGFLTQVPLWKKSFLIKNNYLFDEELDAGQEWEFHSRILFNYPTYAIVNKPLVYLRLHKSNISNQPRSKVLFNYYLARFKIFKSFNKKMDEKSYKYFTAYFIWVFKLNLRYLYFQNANHIFLNTVLPSNEISINKKVRFFLGLYVFRVFKKGNFLIKNIN